MIRTTLLFVMVFLVRVVGQVQPIEHPSFAARAEKAAKPVARQAGSPAALSFSNSEVFTNYTIQPGGTLTLDSALDYSSSDSVSVTVRSADSDLGNVNLLSYWSTPNSVSYDLVEAASGAKFYFSNVGGAKFNVFGNNFRLILQNTGSAPVSIVQVVIYV